ncbi:hypothetical protein SERLADRAFT_369665 [Serpula lacrymans var. lacrymans S7.9]|uniref:Uncharacterized protein n=1 Tax=Serpula lacrymans var. lacrymans (strain S7.9) TaxID=578457 RepID=F8NWS3_SERL9|nr:uncharacterized protein SERLADRAFT_369665 [Serpula lacrymans var. lacrymans S7.9]EGO25078.1 hypothetical protein SERLADRAFT_369665 [Serpula lacrymans var. lacrymans S7.9]
MNKATRCLLFLFVFHPRDGILDPPSSPSDSTTSTPPSTTPSPPSTSTTPPSTTTTPTSSAASPSATPSTSSTAKSASSTTTTSLTTTGTPSKPPDTSTDQVTSASTGANGSTVFLTLTPTSSAPASTTSSSGGGGSGSSGGLGTGSIIGLSVAGGVAAIGIISFFVWKFTRKRFTDFDDNEAIKWPELNTHGQDSHPLPTNSTGRSGFGAESASDVNLNRAPSISTGYAHSIATTSTPELYGATSDPYAVPPLPHLNPNQPYRDDPGYGQNGYYDPYRGPIPNTFNDGASDVGHGTEAIPMTQMSRTRSPAPNLAYDMTGRASPSLTANRHSPGPQVALGYGMDDRSRSPLPGAVVGGRASPAPQGAYGYGPR